MYLNNNKPKELISYRIPYKTLLFKKVDSHYEANFTLTFELFDSTEFVNREIKSSTISTSEYDDTKSDMVYYQNFVEFNITPGKYKLVPNLSFNDVNNESKIPPVKFTVDSLNDSKIYLPIFVNHNKNKNGNYTLLNFENKLLFSPDEYDMLIGIQDTTINTMNYSITQFKKQVIKDSSTNYTKAGLQFADIDNKIEIKEINSGDNINIFKVTGFSQLLSEGKAELEIGYGKVKKTFPIIIKWIGKPKILNNPEYAIKLLGYIEDADVVKELFADGEDKYYQSLFDYWNTNYPSKGSKYNYAMNEYYKRADYALEHFSSLGTNDGAESDRGQIYITYGKPSKVERNYSEKNEIMEIWKYDKLGKTFVFKDTTGTGKFILVQ